MKKTAAFMTTAACVFALTTASAQQTPTTDTLVNRGVGTGTSTKDQRQSTGTGSPLLPGTPVNGVSGNQQIGTDNVDQGNSTNNTQPVNDSNNGPNTGNRDRSTTPVGTGPQTNNTGSGTPPRP